jgi:gamma-glutamyl phosphate reductase
VPPRSAVTPPQPLPPHRRAQLKWSLTHCRVHLTEMLPRSCPLGSIAVVAATRPSCAPHGAAAACVPSGSNVVAAPTSPSCTPHGAHRRTLASGIRRCERVPRSTIASVSQISTVACLLPGSDATRAFQGWGRNCWRR